MVHQTPVYRISQKFEVEITFDKCVERERRYIAYCRGLRGCYVYASTKAEALRRMRYAIPIWLELASRQMEGEEMATTDTIAQMVSDYTEPRSEIQ